MENFREDAWSRLGFESGFVVLMKTRRRSGISEVMAAVITIAITIIAGAALFGYINGEAANSENKLGTANAANVNFLNEHFVVAQIVYDKYPASPSITIYFYNSGHVVDNFASIEVFNSSAATTSGYNPVDIMYNSSLVVNLNQPSCKEAASSTYESDSLGNAPNSFSVPIGNITAITLTLPPCYVSPGPSSGQGAFDAGLVYGVKVIGQYGNVVTSYQEM